MKKLLLLALPLITTTAFASWVPTAHHENGKVFFFDPSISVNQKNGNKELKIMAVSISEDGQNTIEAKQTITANCGSNSLNYSDKLFVVDGKESAIVEGQTAQSNKPVTTPNDKDFYKILCAK